MAMDPQVVASTGLAAINVVLLVVLTAIWIRNYRAFRTTLTLGLIGFAAVMLVKNLLTVQFFLGTGMLYASDPAAQTAVIVLQSLQFVAVAILTFVTVK